jgi:hypothetical protein
VEANRADAEGLALLLPGEDVPLVPTHWSFPQLAINGFLNQRPELCFCPEREAKLS